MAFELTSTAFREGATIPKKHTCDGADLSVPLSWTEPPERTEAFALIVDDPDAPGRTWVHWVLDDIPGHTRALAEALPPEGVLADGTKQGVNDFGRLGYGGPCPPPGPAHRYVFRLFALDRKSGLGPGATKEQVLRAIEDCTLASAQLTGIYRR